MKGAIKVLWLFLALFSLSTAHAADSLVVYTSQPSDQMTDVVALFNQRNPGITVEIFRSGTTEILNKLAAERLAGVNKADVVLIADTVAMSDLKARGVLQPYAEANITGIPVGQVDVDKTYFGTKLITTGIIYNTKSGRPRPTSWKDLLKPVAGGQVILPSPLYSGAAVIHVGTMAADTRFGWEYFQRLVENGAVSAKGNGAVRDAVAKGEKAYGIIVEYMAFEQMAKGSPVEFIFPSEGVTVVTQPVAILKDAPHLAAARAFVDFQLSREAQAQAVSQKYFPILAGVTAPAGYPDPASLTIMTADPVMLLQTTEDTKKQFAILYGN